MRSFKWRIGKALASSLLLLGFALFGEPIRAQEPDFELPKAPKEVERLLNSSQVKFRFYRARPVGQEYDGETRFNFMVNYRFRFRTQYTRNAAGVLAKVSLNYSLIQIKKELRVSLPNSYANSSMWDSQLVQHELEHVRISADPRIEVLLRKLVSTVNAVEIALAGPSRVQETQVRKVVDKEIAERIGGLTELIQANNDMLDAITSHGKIWTDRDENFFNRLYTESNLKDRRFQWLDEVQSTLNSRRYRDLSKADTRSKTSSKGK